MSADGKGDTGNLNKDEKSSTATHSEGIPVTSTVDENIVPSKTDTDQAALLTPASKADLPINDDTETNDEEIETIIEKKLPIEKDKGLDVDSELDFELKWDDDTDLLDDTDKEIESTLTSTDEGVDSTSKNTETAPTSIEKDLDSEKDIESILTSTDEGLDSVTKDLESSTTTSNLKDLDNEERATESILASIDDALDSDGKDVGTTLTSIDKAIDNADEEIQATAISTDQDLKHVEDNKEMTITSTVKGLSSTSQETEVDSEKFGSKVDDKVETNTALDTNIMDVDKVADEGQNKSDVVVHSDELKNADVSEKDTKTFENNATTIDLDTKVSPNESEANSLDEELVYSDAEVPDIEDNDLLDEIDSQLTDIKENIDELEILDTEKIQALPEPSAAQENSKENETKQKNLVSDMDVDTNLIDSTHTTEKSDLNDTWASGTDMETSSYNINNEHKLDRPDVMLEIPTQEFIESFDDSGETSDTTVEDKDKVKQSDILANKPDVVEYSTLKENSAESQTSVYKTNVAQSVSDKDDNPKSPCDTLIKDKVENTVDTNKSADDFAVVDKMDVDISATSEEAIKQHEENPKVNPNEEKAKLNQEKASAIEETLTHAETVLEKLNQDNLVPTEEKISEGDIILEAKSEQPKDKDLDKSSPTEETDVDKEGGDKPSEDQHLKEVQSKHKDIDVAQPSTSKDHQELSDEDQETTDSLGLLAESSRVMDDEDEQEPENDEDDDDDDFDQDDESNQMTAEHSEDSNAQHSESDVPKESTEIDESNDAAEPQVDDATDLQEMETDNVDIHEADTVDIHEADTVDIQEADTVDENEAFDDTHVVDDESIADKEDFQIQIGGIVSEKAEETEEMEESVELTVEAPEIIEAQKAVEALLEDKPAEEVESSDAPEPAAKIEEVKPPEDVGFSAIQKSRLRALLLKDSSDSSNDTSEAEQKSPARAKDVDISKQQEINIVELEESSEDDVQVYKPDDPVAPSSPKKTPAVPTTVDVSASEEESSDFEKKEEKVAPKPAEVKQAKLDAEEVKTASPAAEAPALPETMAQKTPETRPPIDLGEIFSLDSDDEDTADKTGKRRKRHFDTDKSKDTNNCINDQCDSDASVPLVPASSAASIYYAANAQRGSGLCLNCAQRFEDRSKKLIEGVKDFTPYLNMDMCTIREELVEISDSDSDDDAIPIKKDDEIIGEKGAKLLEEQLADMFNDTWKKYDMEARLLAAQDEISLEVLHLEEECKKIDAMLHDCQTETDKLRNDLYDTFADERRELPSICIIDTPINQWSGLEETLPLPVEIKESRQAKRGLPAPDEPTAKRPAIPLGYAPLDANKEPSREAKRGLPAPAEPTAKRPAIPLGYAPLDANKEPSREAKRGLPAPAEPTAKRPAIPLGYAPLDANKEPSREAKRGLPAPAEPTAKRPAIPLGYAPLDANKEPSREAKRGLPAPAEPTAKRPAIPLGYAPLDANKEPSREAKRGLPAPAEPTAKRPAIPLGYAPLDANKEPSREAKRGLPAPAEPTAKRPAIPLGYAPLDANKEPDKKPTQPPAEVPVATEDDNADISVVKLSVESAPAGLPPPGVATRPPLKPNMYVYAMRNTFGAWHKVKIVEVHPKINGQFTMCRVRFEHPKTTSKVLPARCLAYEHAPDVRLTIGTRVVALFKDHRNLEDLEKKEAYYSGIVAEIPNPVNKFRYLIFFDDGYAQYVQHAVTRLVCECAPRVWDEVHPLSRQFVRDYLRAYPERPMVRLHAGQNIKTEWNGRWWPSTILQVDASLVHVSFDGKKEAGIDKTEWIYRGSTRLAPLFLELQAAERQRSRPLPRAQGRRFNMPYVEYTRTDEPADSKPAPPESPVKPPAPTQSLAQTQAQIEQEIRRQRAVAKKSTHAAVAPPPQPVRENVTSRVVYYSPKNAIKPHKWVPHTCGPQCKRTDVLALKDLRTYNPLTKPLLSGWERHTLRFRAPQSKTAMYRAPCGRRIRNHRELHQYLQAIDSDMSVDLFDFNGHTHCLAEFVLNKCIVSKKDLSHGKENVPVPCVNYYDDSLPEFCSYNTERTPTAGVPLNLDPEFLCGCDCTDDCADKSKCACWKMTLEGARTIGLDTNEVGYVYKRLPEPLPSGIYECNSRCKCRQTCLNRVAQHPLQLKLQVFKTANRGWGIRALNDVPKGAFLCVYAGNLLTDATANLDGLNEGDEYLAELDYIEVVEQMKEGFEEDIPDDAKKADQEDESTTSASSDEEPQRDADDDFRPALPAGPCRVSEYSKRLRKRDKSKKAKENEEKGKKAREDKDSEDCITISDDEELREPARFAAQTGMGGKEFVSKYKSVRTLFGKDEACYIMDAKVQGNIGRYLNHSCTPNVFVQNVFVDTHDPRFPWVAFFALSHIKAGTELTWNYNYDVGSVPGKVLYCYCNAPNCRGRLL